MVTCQKRRKAAGRAATKATPLMGHRKGEVMSVWSRRHGAADQIAGAAAKQLDVVAPSCLVLRSLRRSSSCSMCEAQAQEFH